jgi:hypothetical protein
MQLEYLWRGLYLTQEQPERIECHALCDKAAKAKAHESLLMEHEFFALDSWHDEFVEDTLQGRIFFECLRGGSVRSVG